MRSAFKIISEIPNRDKAEYKRALRQWVESLPRSDAQATSLFVSEATFSPLKILEEVENETDLGREFLGGLYALSLRLKAAGKSTPIADLIRRSS
jgi:hypothetical protein